MCLPCNVWTYSIKEKFTGPHDPFLGNLGFWFTARSQAGISCALAVRISIRDSREMPSDRAQETKGGMQGESQEDTRPLPKFFCRRAFVLNCI